MNDYWIGDWVKILASEKLGLYEGEINGKAKIKIERDFLLLDYCEFELLPEELIPTKNELPAKEKINISNNKINFDNTLDLHIEKLKPSMVNAIPEMILKHQLLKAKEFIESAIEKRIFRIVMIHGKGLGALKMEIEHLLGDYPQLNYFITINDGGATEVYFKY
jgi:hypothetical protein